MPRGCLLFLLLLPLIYSKCVVDFPSGTCEDSLCYATFLHHSEGTVKKLGCVSSAKVDKKPLECKKYLALNDTNGVCFERGSRKTCCCNATEVDQCNKPWDTGFQWPELGTSEMMFLLICICLVLSIPILIEGIPFDQEEQVAAEVVEDFHFCDRIMFRVKVIFFLGFGIAAWFPFFRNCGSHQEGEFQSKLFFVAQVLSNPYLGYSLTTLPFINIVWDIHRYGNSKQNVAPFRRQTTTALFLALVFASLTGVFIWKTVELWKYDKVTESYCRVGSAVWQIFSAGAFMVSYLVAVLFHEGWLFRLRRQNDQLLGIEANEARSREFNTALCDEGQLTAVETALSNTTVREEDHIDFSPRPFSLDSSGEGVLTISNLHPLDWIAIRILCSIPHKYAIHPSKLVLPPLRAATVSVRYLDMHSSEKRPALMIQWYSVGTSAPPMDATRLWQKPHLRHRSQWKFFVLPIYHEL